jgi:phosphatidylserine synthase
MTEQADLGGQFFHGIPAPAGAITVLLPIYVAFSARRQASSWCGSPFSTHC